MTIKDRKNEVVLSVKNLRTYYPVFGGVFKRKIAEVKAVDGVSFTLHEGETLALVGESGCGKTTIGNTILNLVPATDGEVYLKDKRIISGSVNIEEMKAQLVKKKKENERKKALKEQRKTETKEEKIERKKIEKEEKKESKIKRKKEKKERKKIEKKEKKESKIKRKKEKKERKTLLKQEKKALKEQRKTETKEEKIERKKIEKEEKKESKIKRKKEKKERKTLQKQEQQIEFSLYIMSFLIGWNILFYILYLIAFISNSNGLITNITFEIILYLLILVNMVFIIKFRRYWEENLYKFVETYIGILIFTLFALKLYQSGTNIINYFNLNELQEAGYLVLFILATTLFNPMIYSKIYLLTLIWIDNYMKLHGRYYKNPEAFLPKYHSRLMNKINIYSKDVRKRVQLVFQDPDSSLNPRWKVVNIIGEPLRALLSMKGSKKIRRDVLQLLETVSMKNEHLDRYPHEFSGGQKQRIVISRALASNPDVIVLDEPTSALDVSVQAQILNLLKNLQKKFNLSFLFITHDLSVVQHIADRVAVMYLGKFVEVGKVDDVFYNPSHPYTKALLSARPTFDPSSRAKRIILEGEIPSPINPPMGCAFHPRCYAQDEHMCDDRDPVKIKISDDHYMWCKPFKK